MSYSKKWEKDLELLNNVELIKLKKDGLDVFETIYNKYSKLGFNSVSDDDKVLLKWMGVYEQKPKNGLLMLRVRINSGKLNTNQAKILASISKKYGKDYLKITTRGAIQFYNIKIENLPEIFEKLKSVGLYTFESAGDCPRTIIGNPLAGIDKNELIDTTELVNKVNSFFLLNRDFSNLPRKLKISISSNTNNNGNAEINDISFTPANKTINGKTYKGFHLKVGGGLSSKPMLAKEVNIFVKPQKVLDVTRGIATIFRDYGYRKNRSHARLKFLVDDWGVQKFTEKLFENTGKLESRGIDKTISWNYSYCYGVHRQKQKGKYYIGLHIPLGELNSTDLSELAYISELYGDKLLRTTSSQNIILSGIKKLDIKKILEIPIIRKYSPNPTTIMSNIVVCTGSKYCNFALANTQDMANELASAIDKKIKLDLPIRINITACPNSCGHMHIADIGLRAGSIQTERDKVEAYEIYVGGKLGPGARFAEKLETKLEKSKAIYFVCKIIEFYFENRNSNELFNEFCLRIGISEFNKLLKEC